MPISEFKSLIELIEKSQSYRKISHQQRMLELTLVNMHHFSEKAGTKAVTGSGRYAITEHELTNVQGLSKLDLFNSIKEAEIKGLIEDCSTFNQREWFLTPDGIMYVEALLEVEKQK